MRWRLRALFATGLGAIAVASCELLVPAHVSCESGVCDGSDAAGDDADAADAEDEGATATQCEWVDAGINLLQCNCGNGTCCVTSSGVQCSDAGCPSGAALSCLTSNTCDAGGCCLEHVVMISKQCPAIITVNPPATATCQQPCSAPNYKLCISSPACGGAQQCVAAIFAGTDAAIGGVGVCMQPN